MPEANSLYVFSFTCCRQIMLSISSNSNQPKEINRAENMLTGKLVDPSYARSPVTPQIRPESDSWEIKIGLQLPSVSA